MTAMKNIEERRIMFKWRAALAALATSWGSRVGIQFRRTTERYAGIRGESGTSHLFVAGRRASLPTGRRVRPVRSA